MTTHQIKQWRPDAEETGYFWKLFHAAQRNDARFHGSEIHEVAEALSNCPNLSRVQKLFLLRAWQVLVDDKGGFGRFIGAFDTYVYNIQDPNVPYVAFKPEFERHIEKGYLFDTVLEAYSEAKQLIAELEANQKKIESMSAYSDERLKEIERHRENSLLGHLPADLARELRQTRSRLGNYYSLMKRADVAEGKLRELEASKQPANEVVDQVCLAAAEIHNRGNGVTDDKAQFIIDRIRGHLESTGTVKGSDRR